MEKKMFDMVFPVLQDISGKVIITSTPKGNGMCSTFHELYKADIATGNMHIVSTNLETKPKENNKS